MSVPKTLRYEEFVCAITKHWHGSLCVTVSREVIVLKDVPAPRFKKNVNKLVSLLTNFLSALHSW